MTVHAPDVEYEKHTYDPIPARTSYHVSVTRFDGIRLEDLEAAVAEARRRGAEGYRIGVQHNGTYLSIGWGD